MSFYEFQIFTPYIPLVMLALLFCSVWLLRPKRVIVRREEWAFILAPFLVVFFAAASIDPSDALIKSSTFLYAAIIFLAVRYCLRVRVLKENGLLSLSLIIFCILTTVAVLQFVLQEPVGVISNYLGENSSQETLWQGQLRVSGTFGNANVFAQVYIIYSAIVVAQCLYHFRSTRLYTALLISGVSIFIVTSSMSRSGLLFAIILHMILYAFWLKCAHNSQRIRFFGVTVTVAGLVIGTALLLTEGRISAGERFLDYGDYGRIETYMGAMRLLLYPSNAFFGVGSGQFFEGSAMHGIDYNYKAWLDSSEMSSSVHNWTLQIATENGLVVLFLYVYAIAKTIRRGWSIRNLNSGWFAACLAITIATLYVIPLQFGTTGTSPWILTPVAIILAWIQNEYDVIRNQYAQKYV